MVSNGNTVTVRVTASGGYSIAVAATLTIGGVSDTFTVTTVNSSSADTTPDAFTFTDQMGTALSTVATSISITVTGITGAAAISITGGTYSINGGAYTSSAGMVNNGNTVTVRVTSSASYSTVASATLTIGGVSGMFNVTTHDNTTPDAFTFTDQTGAALNTVVASNTITVSGITAPAAISISGGEYSINGGTYTGSAGTVNNGDTLTVQVTSSGSYATTVEAALTVGGVSDTFSVTTLNDPTVPSSTPPADTTPPAKSKGGGMIDPALLLLALFGSYSLARRRNPNRA